jgi:hypothetical protein
MSKHTPGPWYIDPIKARANGNRRIMAEQCTPVAVVPEHLAADARLIAAAPEMYELLTKIRGHIDSTCRECESKAIVPEIDALLAKICHFPHRTICLHCKAKEETNGDN